MIDIFMSASVPVPGRDTRFLKTLDVVAIREAVKALVLEVVPVGRLTFGGHPAITPLVAMLMREVAKDYRGNVTIFQSQNFERQFVSENDEFVDLRIVASENLAESSLEAMRAEMLSSREFDAAFFFGGMEGVIEEFEAFRTIHPNATCFPIASTGSAAAELFVRGEYDSLLKTELTYPSLFRKLLSEL